MKSIIENLTSPLPASLFVLVVVSFFALPSAMGQIAFTSGSDGSDGAFVFSAPPEARRHMGSAYDPVRDEVLIFGGENASAGDRKRDLFAWDGSEWIDRSPSSFPNSRSRVASAWDSNRNVFVIFGGFDAGANDESDETWEYDGNQWRRIALGNSPPRRQGAAMVFDSTRNVMVLFGGVDNSTELNDTWEYNGTSWSQRFVTGPPTMAFHAMAYDAARFQVVLFGGTNNLTNSGTLDQTWIFNGTTWTQKTVSTIPQRRWLHAMEYDPVNERVWMHGGLLSDNQASAELWEWDGAAWTRASVGEVSPPGRFGHAFVYDPDRDRIVLFGGQRSVILSDTWLLDATAKTWSAPSNVQPEVVVDLQADAIGLNVFYYSEIRIPEGVTVTFNNRFNSRPVVWLATGDVRIDGVVDLSGEDGGRSIAFGGEARGGPGGFSGGIAGGARVFTGRFAGTPGLGPGGGKPGAALNQNAGHAAYETTGGQTLDGSVYGNAELIPIVGGSGGGGGGSSETDYGSSGGGGGGAILISGKTIEVNGQIIADGGTRLTSSGDGGLGSGGAIKLIASSISGSGSLSANPRGRIRLEALDAQYTGTTNPSPSSSPPRTTNVAASLNLQPVIEIVKIDGVDVISNRANPNAPSVSFSAKNTAVTIELETQNIPENTVINLRMTTSGNQRAQIFTATTTPVASDGTATASVVLPSGVGSVQAFVSYLRP